MKFKDTKISCSNCDKEFYSEFWGGGSIEHDNIISNMHVYVNHWELAKKGDDFYTKERSFLALINLDGNYCNIKDNEYKTGVSIYKCALKWLENNGLVDFYKYIKSRECDISAEYNRILDISISKLQEEICWIEQRRITDK